MLKVNKMDRVTINLSQEFDNKANGVQLDFSYWIEKYGEGAITLTHKRRGEKLPYAIALEVEGNIATWVISDIDTAIKGNGKAQLMYQPYDTDILVNSAVFNTVCLGSNYDVKNTPDPYDNWIAELTELGGETIRYAAMAKESELYAKESELYAKASELNAHNSEENAKSSELKAKASENNAKSSELAAKTSEENASASETAAKLSEDNAKNSENKAKTSETNTKASEENAQESARRAAETESNVENMIEGFDQRVNAAKTEAVNTIVNKQTEAVNAVDAKKTEGVNAVQEVLDTIPEDYTEVLEDISNVKKDLRSLGLVVENDMLCVEMEG